MYFQYEPSKLLPVQRQQLEHNFETYSHLTKKAPERRPYFCA